MTVAACHKPCQDWGALPLLAVEVRALRRLNFPSFVPDMAEEGLTSMAISARMNHGFARSRSTSEGDVPEMQI